MLYLHKNAAFNGGSTQNTPTGEIIVRRYELVVRRVSDEMYFFPEVSLTITVDYFEQTINLS